MCLIRLLEQNISCQHNISILFTQNKTSALRFAASCILPVLSEPGTAPRKSSTLEVPSNYLVDENLVGFRFISEGEKNGKSTPGRSRGKTDIGGMGFIVFLHCVRNDNDFSHRFGGFWTSRRPLFCLMFTTHIH